MPREHSRDRSSRKRRHHHRDDGYYDNDGEYSNEMKNKKSNRDEYTSKKGSSSRYDRERSRSRDRNHEKREDRHEKEHRRHRDSIRYRSRSNSRDHDRSSNHLNNVDNKERKFSDDQSISSIPSSSNTATITTKDDVVVESSSVKAIDARGKTVDTVDVITPLSAAREEESQSTAKYTTATKHNKVSRFDIIGPKPSSSVQFAESVTESKPLKEEEKIKQRKERLAQWKSQKLAASEKQSENDLVKLAQVDNKHFTSIATKNGLSVPTVKSTTTIASSTVKPMMNLSKPSVKFLFSLNKKCGSFPKTNSLFGETVVNEDEEEMLLQKKKITKIDFSALEEEQQQEKEQQEEKALEGDLMNEDKTDEGEEIDLQKEEEEVDALDLFMTEVQETVKELVNQDKERMDTTQAKSGNEPSIVNDENNNQEGNENDENEANYLEMDDAEAIIAAAAKRIATKKKELPPIDHSTIDYLPFRKDFWVEPPEIAELSKEELDLKRAGLDNIKIRGLNCPKPVDAWSLFGLPHSIYEVIRKVLKYENPSPIQAQAIPAVMSGRDVIGIAKTGSGKTIAFLLPLFRHIKDQAPLQSGEGPIALIMTPTRELAIQIYRDCKLFAKVTNLRAVCAYGGAPIKDQIGDLKRGAEIVICTPGRMIDLLCANSGRVTNLRRVTYLVLDEADRMFDMGFEPQVMKIVNNIRPNRQTVLFSATFPRQMEALARKILQKSLEITVGGRSVVCQDVEQIVEVRESDTKFLRLLEIMGQAMSEDPETKILIFVDRHEAADNMLRDLLRRGYPCQSLHGGKDQEDRDSTLSDFKSGNTNILIATSVAARGLDVKQLKMVINYECPNHLEDYVHRVGRTGRAGNKGIAYTFITPEQERYAVDILKALKMSGATIPEELEKLTNDFIAKVKAGGAKYASHGFGGKGLERFEQEREMLKKIQRKTHGGEFADIDEDEEKEPVDSEDEVIDMGDIKFEAKLIENVVEAEAPPVVVEEEEENSTLITEDESGAITTTASSGLEKAKELIAAYNAKGKAVAAAAAAAKEAAKETAPAPTKRTVAYEIEINDYPQKARWKVTNKEMMSTIQMMSGAALTTRGLYFPPGKVPGEGQRKLYLYIEAETKDVIDKAKNEIKRLLFETTVSSLEKEGNVAGRYSVI